MDGDKRRIDMGYKEDVKSQIESIIQQSKRHTDDIWKNGRGILAINDILEAVLKYLDIEVKEEYEYNNDKRLISVDKIKRCSKCNQETK